MSSPKNFWACLNLQNPNSSCIVAKKVEPILYIFYFTINIQIDILFFRSLLIVLDTTLVLHPDWLILSQKLIMFFKLEVDPISITTLFLYVWRCIVASTWACLAKHIMLCGQECLQVERGKTFYDFQFNTRLVKSTIVHFQVESLVHRSPLFKVNFSLLST